MNKNNPADLLQQDCFIKLSLKNLKAERNYYSNSTNPHFVLN